VSSRYVTKVYTASFALPGGASRLGASAMLDKDRSDREKRNTRRPVMASGKGKAA
jgi:hypothetical protein